MHALRGWRHWGKFSQHWTSPKWSVMTLSPSSSNNYEHTICCPRLCDQVHIGVLILPYENPERVWEGLGECKRPLVPGHRHQELEHGDQGAQGRPLGCALLPPQPGQQSVSRGEPCEARHILQGACEGQGEHHQAVGLSSAFCIHHSVEAHF